MTRIHEDVDDSAAWAGRDFERLRRMFSSPGGIDRWLGDDGESLLHLAVRENDDALLVFLLQFEHAGSLASFDYLAYTPLHVAAREGRADAVQRLLAAGADPNAHQEERIGNTPIREAVFGGHPEIVAMLLRAGADPTIPGWMAISAVDEAYNNVEGGLDSPAAAAIQGLLAPFPSALRDRPRG